MYKIGNYLFDEKLAQVTNLSGDVVDLSPLVFKLLLFLIHNNDRLVSKQELILKVWTQHVSSGSIDKTISQLRKVFGDSATDPTYIITRRKLGYRLVMPVTSNVPHEIKIINRGQFGTVQS